MQRYMRLVAGARIVGLFSSLLGAPAMTFDHKWLRTVPPGQLSTTKAHCDIVYMGGGTQELFTVWTPLDDIALEMGPDGRSHRCRGPTRNERDARHLWPHQHPRRHAGAHSSGDALETARACSGAGAGDGGIPAWARHPGLRHAHLHARTRSTTAAGATASPPTTATSGRTTPSMTRHMGEVESARSRPNLSQEWLAEFGGELGR